MNQPDLAALATQVQTAVQALYHAAAEHQSAANAWLNAWASSADAWQVALGVLQQPSASLEVSELPCGRGASSSFSSCPDLWADTSAGACTENRAG